MSARGNKKCVYTVLIVFFATVLVIFGFLAAKDILPRIKNIRQIKYLQTMSPLNTACENSEMPITGMRSFEQLHNINPDIKAWIYIEGTRVDLPVVQALNNSYYLYVSYTDEYSGSGSIFLDCGNHSDFSDQNTVLYGHSMLDGTMFASLSRYKNQSFYSQNPLITIITEDGTTYYYQVFSVNVLESAFDYRQSNYGENFMSLIDMLRNDSLITSHAVVDENSKIITLSTCTDTIEDGRLAVFGVLLNADGRALLKDEIVP